VPTLPFRRPSAAQAAEAEARLAALRRPAAPAWLPDDTLLDQLRPAATSSGGPPPAAFRPTPAVPLPAAAPADLDWPAVLAHAPTRLPERWPAAGVARQSDQAGRPVPVEHREAGPDGRRAGEQESGPVPVEPGEARLAGPRADWPGVPPDHAGPVAPGRDHAGPVAPGYGRHARPDEAPVGGGAAAGVRARLAGLVPESLVGARLDPGRRGAVSLVVVALVAAAVVGFMTWRSRPAAVPVTAPPVVRSGIPAGPAGPAGPSPVAGQARLVVAVSGKVRRPGVVSLPAGARVLDAVRAAGGPLPGVDLGALNLARRVADGELIFVGGPPPAGAVPPGDGSAVPGGQPGGPLDLNAATVEQLDALPGVGPVLAQRIVDYRAAHGGRFESVDQLRDVDGIGDSKFGELRDKVTV
jgi:competence protein ComEA